MFERTPRRDQAERTVRSLLREVQPARLRRVRTVSAAQDISALRSLTRATPHTRRARGLLPPSRHNTETWAISQVKNEVDVLGHTIGHLLEQGVSRILIVDNASTDGTTELLQDLSRHAPITIIPDRLHAYYQDTRMTRLTRAASRLGAGWIVPFDGDEIWVTQAGGTLADFFAQCRDDVVRAVLHNHVPFDDDTEIADPVARIRHWTCDPVGRPKVAFRAWPLAHVAIGNHAVARPGRVGDGLAIHHFPYRSLEYFATKVPTTLAAIEATDYAADIGSHIRREASLPPNEAWTRWVELQGPLTDAPWIRR